MNHEELTKKITILGNKLSHDQWRDVWGILREAGRDQTSYWSSAEHSEFVKLRNIINEHGIMGPYIKEEEFRDISIKLANTFSHEEWKIIMTILHWYNDCNKDIDFKKTSEILCKFFPIHYFY